jgi:hypothetical protein
MARVSTFDSLVEAIGRDAAERFVKQFGGSNLWIIARPSANNRVVQLLGLELAYRLGQRFAGAYLDIPLHPTFGVLRRQIRALNQAGLTVNEIRAELRVSRQYIQLVLRQPHNRP